jgi:hypothetical protein
MRGRLGIWKTLEMVLRAAARVGHCAGELIRSVPVMPQAVMAAAWSRGRGHLIL